MFGLTTKHKMQESVYHTMSSALEIAKRTEFMLSRPELKVIERLNEGEVVSVGAMSDEIWPPINAAFNTNPTFDDFELGWIGVVLANSFSAQIFPVKFSVIQLSDGSLRASIHPAP